MIFKQEHRYSIPFFNHIREDCKFNDQYTKTVMNKKYLKELQRQSVLIFLRLNIPDGNTSAAFKLMPLHPLLLVPMNS